GGRWLLAYLAAIFFLEQLVTAAFDWENNPRRALPLVFVFCVVYFALVQSGIAKRGWRIAFLCLAVISGYLALSDTILRNPVVPYLEMGEAVKDPAKTALGVTWERLDRGSLPRLMHDDKTVWRDMQRARS